MEANTFMLLTENDVADALQVSLLPEALAGGKTRSAVSEDRAVGAVRREGSEILAGFPAENGRCTAMRRWNRKYMKKAPAGDGRSEKQIRREQSSKSATFIVADQSGSRKGVSL